MLNVAILDGYAGAAMRLTDWSDLRPFAKIEAIERHLAADEAAAVLAPFHVLCTTRERRALPRTLLEQLPNLKLITINGQIVNNLDQDAATELGIAIVSTSQPSAGSRTDNAANLANTNRGAVAEFAWALLLSTIPIEDRRVRRGLWQRTLGTGLFGRTLGIVGLGRLGAAMAAYGTHFGMTPIAWSKNLTDAAAAQAGARRVDKDELFQTSDVVTVHYALSARSIGLIGAHELGLMKPTAYLINTSRSPIVDEQALIAALRDRRIADAGLDVFDEEPLPVDHPFRSLDNMTATPNLGYSTDGILSGFYAGMVQAVIAYAKGQDLRLVNPSVQAHPRQQSRSQ